MKTTLEDISPVKKRLLVEIDAAEVDKKLNKAYSDIRKQVKLPGFRPGKAPRKILESHYGSQIKEDVAKELISDSFPKAIDETKAFPLSQPVLERETLNQGSHFKYSAVMDVRPEFEVTNHMGVALDKEILTVTDQDVENRLEEIRWANGTLTPILEKRPIKEGDYVIVDYTGFENGQPLEGIQSSNFLVKVGQHDFHPTFDDALIGLTKDDQTEIDIDFETDFHQTKLAGKQVRFKVTIVDVKEMTLPELDDAFARSLGSDFENLEDLKKEVRKAITSQKEQRIDRELKEKLVARILEGVSFELPEVLVESETDFAVYSFKENLKRGGANIEKTGLAEERLRKDFRPMSEKRVREMLLLEQIAKQEQIVLTDEDIEEGYKDVAQQMGQDVATIKRYYEARGQMENLKEGLLREKTLKYLMDHATLTEVEKAEPVHETARKAEEG